MAEETNAASPAGNETTTTTDASLLAADAEQGSENSTENTTEEIDDGGVEVALDTSKKPDATDKDKPILGKFKTQDDLVKAYQNLEKKIGEKGPVVPETYDLEEPMKAIGWQPMDREANPEVYSNFERQLKDNGFSQKQTEFMFQLGKDIIADQVAKLGPATDPKREAAGLKEDWGETYDAKRNEVSKWATANLAADVLTKPLGNTAEGMRLLYDLMAKSKGATPIMNADRAPAFDKDEAELQINELMKQPEYWKSGTMGDALRSKVEGIFKKMGGPRPK